MSTTTPDEGGQEAAKRVIRLNIPPRFFYVTGTALIVGTAIGIVRGGRLAGLRFLAENVHRPPTTVQGWYFYNKTKNYKVILGGLKGAGAESVKLGLAAVGWVCTEEGVERLGWSEGKDTCAGVATAGTFSAVYRLPWKMSVRTVGLGLIVGSTLDVLRWGRREVERGEISEGERE